ncbi:TauD/TfdA family dioxygenase [Parafrankia sp. EUN1f]|uniref:TauD/TfdA dioxygenase family protein n=1 Tax=Parafrankia sp. EUN1f TaxID=102897 RepID=UPI0001C459C4|nr:TauD/TfdA family dioxygenase [Parafrankia sp. EUN1f]EFC86523.1 Taurine dioxygenase [Parafrankia sp. EUN1f]
MTTIEAPTTLLRVEPIHPTIGAVVHGVDASRPLDPATVAFVRQALLDHKAIFLRGQHLDLEQQGRFAEHFGDLTPHPIQELAGGYPDFEWLMQQSIRTRAEGWHSDMAFLPEPPFATLLTLPVIPPVGGDTLFLDLEAAYNDLSEPVRTLVDDLTVIHYADNFQDWAWGPNVDEARRNQILSWAARPVEHPLVRVHPETGRRMLFAVTGFARRIKGLSEEESKGILALLAAHVSRAEYVARFKWSPGDIAFWDNRTVLHRASIDFGDTPRPLQRVTISEFAVNSH